MYIMRFYGLQLYTLYALPEKVHQQSTYYYMYLSLCGLSYFFLLYVNLALHFYLLTLCSTLFSLILELVEVHVIHRNIITLP